jgi:hypothetical protein
MVHDPLKAPEPEERLALDEEERVQIVEDCHRRAGADFRRRADPNQEHFAELQRLKVRAWLKS